MSWLSPRRPKKSHPKRRHLELVELKGAAMVEWLTGMTPGEQERVLAQPLDPEAFSAWMRRQAGLAP